MRTKISLMLPLICAPLAFWGCGDDSSSTKAGSENTDIMAATFEDLPVCSGKREGATAYVKDEKKAYICEDRRWVDDVSEEESSSSGKAGSSSSGKAGSSSSGKSKSSSSSDKAGSSSSDKAGSSSSSKSKSSSSAGSTPDVELELVKIKNKSVAGVCQKGPFVKGSTVKLYELDGETYAQTGKNYSGDVTNNNGDFTVSGVTLANQYAQLEASGYFRSEVTGSKSSGTITLNALTDLSDRKNVNVNLLTHLEYERALYLVGTGINVPAAKKQAEAEVFNAFGIQGEFAYSEDLDIFGEDDGDAALLAVSVLMQGNRSEAEFKKLLTKFASDIEKDGEWNDEATKAKIADWAMGQDLAGGLGKIRSNIKSWNLEDAVDFEKYVRNFWYTNYGLGACDAKSNGAVKAVANEYSEYYESADRYICKSETWVYASDIEKDTYKWSAGNDGEVRNGDVISSNKYVYDEELKAWRKASRIEGELGWCTENIAEDSKKLDGTWYICKDREWDLLVDGEIKRNGDSAFKFDEYEGEWVEADNWDVSEILRGCTTKRIGEVVNIMNGFYCSANGWIRMAFWSLDVPVEARQNPEIEYGSMTDSRDGKTYKTVTIGTQTWMAENLNYYDEYKTPSVKKSSCYDRNSKYCSVFGRLYEWTAAIDSVALAKAGYVCGWGSSCARLTDEALAAKPIQGVCPDGWHLPSAAEFDALRTAVGGPDIAGEVLKSTSGWGVGCGKDAYGFLAFPAGILDDNSFYSEGRFGGFWSATQGGVNQDDETLGFYLYLVSERDVARLETSRISWGYSVRCIKND